MKMNDECSEKDITAKNSRLAWFEAITKMTIPVVILVVGQWFTTAQSESHTKSEYIKMGVSLLATEPNENNKEVRRWAIDLINHYSDVKFTLQAKEEIESNSVNLDLLGRYLPEAEQFYTFRWENNGSDGYELEIQKYENDSWVAHNGICLRDTSATMSIPVGKKVRWRYGSINKGNTTYSEWRYLHK